MKKRILSSIVRCEHAFTLVELLVAMAVISIIGLVIVQLTASTAKVTGLSSKTIDAATQARLAFDRIGLDLKSMVKRNDVDFEAGNPISATRSDLIFFFSSVSSSASSGSSAGNRGISLLAYRIAVHPDNTNSSGDALPCLIRAGKAIPWTQPASWGNAAFMGLKANGLPVRLDDAAADFPVDLLPVASTGAAANDYDVLAPGVIKMVVGFQLYPDNLPVTLFDGSAVGGAAGQGQVVYSPPIKALTATDGSSVDYVDINRISALVIGVVVLDTGSLKLLSSSQVSRITQEFSVPNANTLPVSAWGATADHLTTSLGNSIPPKALQSVRVYQRVFPITPFGTKQQ